MINLVQPSRIEQIYTSILAFKSLKPNNEVNTAFENLVRYSLSQHKIELDVRKISRLQKICSKAEYELELHWSKLIAKSDNSWEKLRQFPYHKNYQGLTKMEWLSLLGCTNHKSHSVLFIGGGPLPLTAIELAKNYNIPVTVLERVKEAAVLSNKLITKLQLGDRVKILQRDAARFQDYSKYNVIFLAALAGVKADEKTRILSLFKTHAKSGTHILARSSWGNRKLLYKPLNVREIMMLKPILEVRPHNDVVNSVIIFQV